MTPEHIPSSFSWSFAMLQAIIEYSTIKFWQIGLYIVKYEVPNIPYIVTSMVFNTYLRTLSSSYNDFRWFKKFYTIFGITPSSSSIYISYFSIKPWSTFPSNCIERGFIYPDLLCTVSYEIFLATIIVGNNE